MKVVINEIDKDYRAWTGSEVKEFKSLKEAAEYCSKESWSGYSYYIDSERTKWLNES